MGSSGYICESLSRKTCSCSRPLHPSLNVSTTYRSLQHYASRQGDGPGIQASPYPYLIARLRWFITSLLENTMTIDMPNNKLFILIPILPGILKNSDMKVKMMIPMPLLITNISSISRLSSLPIVLNKFKPGNIIRKKKDIKRAIAPVIVISTLYYPIYTNPMFIINLLKQHLITQRFRELILRLSVTNKNIRDIHPM